MIRNNIFYYVMKLYKRGVVNMNKDELGVEIHNKEELLRIYENNKNNAKDSIEKSEWDKCIISVNTDIAGLKEKLDKLS